MGGKKDCNRIMQKQIIVLLLFLIFILGGFFIIFNLIDVSDQEEKNEFENNFNLKLSSFNFKNNEFIPAKYTCDGLNVNPALEITGVPQRAKSLLLVMDSNNLTNDDVFIHWLVWNIPVGIKKIEENSLPNFSIEGKNDFSLNKYVGPCFDNGFRSYKFKLYALDIKFDNLSINTDKEKILKLIEGHIIEKTELIGKYSK